MTDAECVAFLQDALPRMGLRWPGFRRVRRQVCKRIARRMHGLGLARIDDYRARLEREPGEWAVLEGMCHIPISRFFRDRGVFDLLGESVLPRLAEAALRRGAAELRVWSAGCASGEEPYSLSILWRMSLARLFPALSLRIVATDADEGLIARMRRGCYRPGSLRELPSGWTAAAFAPGPAGLCIRPEFRAGIDIALQDIRAALPEGRFDLVLCRNVAFTYLGEEAQRDCLARIAACLWPGGCLVVGGHESLPQGQTAFAPWNGRREIFVLQDEAARQRVPPLAARVE